MVEREKQTRNVKLPKYLENTDGIRRNTEETRESA